MTAMCDVAFLLLSFFVMTATAKQPEPKPVDTPASTVIDKLPEDGVATITVGGKEVFFTIPRNIRRGTLERISTEPSQKTTILFPVELIDAVRSIGSVITKK